MRLIKMFGLAAIAAVAAMAFVGASSASAELDTVLCKNATETLNPTNEACDPVTNIHFESVNESNPLQIGKAKLLTSTLTVECNALVSGTVGPLGDDAPQVIQASIVYSNCLGGCTVTTVKNGTILVLKINNPTTSGHDELATVTAHDFEVRVVCLGVINCTYNPKGLEGHGHRGHGLPHVTYKEDLVEGTGILCPESKLDALFRSLTDFFIRS